MYNFHKYHSTTNFRFCTYITNTFFKLNRAYAERDVRLPRQTGGGVAGEKGASGAAESGWLVKMGATTGGIEVYGKHGAKEKGVVGRRKRGESERRDCGLGNMGERGSENGAAGIRGVGENV